VRSHIHYQKKLSGGRDCQATVSTVLSFLLLAAQETGSLKLLDLPF